MIPQHIVWPSIELFDGLAEQAAMAVCFVSSEHTPSEGCVPCPG
mgnify:CR=1 FL=1